MSKNIKCPHCGEVFQVDESGYAQIVSQVRDHEFDIELKRREALLEEKKASDIKLLLLQKERENKESLSSFEKDLHERQQRISQLEARLEAIDIEKKLAINEALQQKEREQVRELQEREEEIAFREKTITDLQNRLSALETEKKLAISEAKSEKDKELHEKAHEITTLMGKLETKETEAELKERSLKEHYEQTLRLKDEQIEYYKDFKARQSTKMMGESLEQHCEIQFNRIRHTAFPNAYFEKDNDARSGSKGDFIFREKTNQGVEFISIMFEMKNEADTTATKKKNEDFFKELDKDRREKNCEYAVLVSMLEADNELYNEGIVDVSHRYEKMYVIRPQFFIPMITLLRNAALNSCYYQDELARVRHQQIDISNFEENMNKFKEGFARNYDIASRKFSAAIEQIDRSISSLQKIKENLLSSENNLRLANQKAEDLSIKRLTKNAPAVKEMFDALEKPEETS